MCIPCCCLLTINVHLRPDHLGFESRTRSASWTPSPPRDTINMTSRDLIFSNYPYPVSARQQTHASIVHPVSDIVRDRLDHTKSFERNEIDNPKRRKTSARKQQRQGYSLEQQRVALEAAEWRAIRGMRPAGVDMAKEADELSEEERVMDDERVCLCL